MTSRPATDTIDAKVLAHVRALLAKAESTTFPEEADALTAKAQQLMGRHAIDRALLDNRSERTSTPDHRQLSVDPPYASAKVTVLGAVAQANRCQVITVTGDERVNIFGYSVDIDATEVLYTSLLLQATSAMNAAGPQTDRSGRSRTRAFRHAFLLAFAHRVGNRLAEATRTAVAESDDEHHGALVPVLADRAAAVDDAVARAFPRLRTRRLSVSSPAGLEAGRIAGDRADLGSARFGGRTNKRLPR